LFNRNSRAGEQSLRNENQNAPINQAAQCLQLVAHRGYQKHYPENTLLAFSKAIEIGAKWIEADIQLSSDGHALVYHDHNLLRVSGKNIDLASLRLDEAVCQPAYEPQRFGNTFVHEKIPSLAQLTELLLLHPEVSCFIEIKRATLKLNTIDTVLSELFLTLDSIRERCCLISFDYAVIAEAKKRGWPQCGIVLENWNDILTVQVQNLSPTFTFCNANKIPADALLANYSTNWAVYEIDNPEIARTLYARGVQFIETFAIGEMLQQLDNPKTC